MTTNCSGYWLKPMWPRSQRRFWIWAAPLLSALFISAIILLSVSKKYERLDSLEVNPSFSHDAVFVWPKGIHFDGIGRVDDCAVVYSTKGYFMIFNKDKIERMIFTGGSQSGLYQFKMFSIHDDGLVYLYSSDANLTGTIAAFALTDSFQKQVDDHKQKLTIDSITYEIRRHNSTEQVIAQSGDNIQILMEKEYINTTVLRGIGIICATIVFSTIFLYFAMNIPVVVGFLNYVVKISKGRFS